MSVSYPSEPELAQAPPPRPERMFRHREYTLRRSRHSGQSLVGRYQLIGLLGQGGMADVFLAEDAVLEKLVVVKRLRSHLASDRTIRERFLIEARASMSIDHPGVIRVQGVESAPNGQPFIVMEALNGEPLSEYLRREEVMPERMVVDLARQLASALARAHHEGIVHRDLKPGNLFLVGERGAPEAIKVIDFGLAHVAASEPLKRTDGHWVVGTAQYMAPEQVLADPIDARTDVYGFGAVLFRCLTGHLPFDLDPGTDLFGHQLFSPAPPPSWLVEGLDPRLEAVILRCMRKRPENRYPSMDAVLGDLEIVASSIESGLDIPISTLELKREPDLYKPQNPKGRDTAELLAHEFGTDPPPPPSSQIRFETSR